MSSPVEGADVRGSNPYVRTPAIGIQHGVERDREVGEVAVVDATVVELASEVVQQPGPVSAGRRGGDGDLDAPLDDLDRGEARFCCPGLFPRPLPAGRRAPFRDPAPGLRLHRRAAPAAGRRRTPSLGDLGRVERHRLIGDGAGETGSAARLTGLMGALRCLPLPARLLRHGPHPMHHDESRTLDAPGVMAGDLAASRLRGTQASRSRRHSHSDNRSTAFRASVGDDLQPAKLAMRVQFPSPAPRRTAGQPTCQVLWRSTGGPSGKPVSGPWRPLFSAPLVMDWSRRAAPYGQVAALVRPSRACP
jgi:hypothetical protein